MAIIIQNGLRFVWKKSLLQVVNSASSVLLVNFADPKGVTWSYEWFKHVLLAIVVLTIFNEAKYWKNWVDKQVDNNNGGQA